MPGMDSNAMGVPISAFEVISILLALCASFLLLRALRTRKPLRTELEARLLPLRLSRLLIFLLLATLQSGVVALLIAQRQAPSWSATQLEELAMLCTWVFHAVTLCSMWSCMASLQLLPSSLLSLSLGIVALVADCLVPPNESSGYNAERVWSIVVHSIAFLLLLAHVVAELVVAQHVEILRSGDGEYLLDPAEKEKEKKQQMKAESASKKITRWNMVLSSFRYVLPQTRPLRCRLAGCFLLVALERCVNLAVPLLYKHMVDTLSQISALHHLHGTLSSIMAGTASHQPADLANSTSSMLAGSVDEAGGVRSMGGLGNRHEEVLGLEGGMGSARGSSMLMGLLSKLMQHPQFTFWNVFHPWVLAYLAAYFLRGGSGLEGLLASIRDILWAPITQAAFRRVSIEVFGHLLDLDHAFHVKRKTGQIMRILDRGTTSIQDTVEIVIFNVLPQLVDIVAACTYLATAMQPWAAAIVAVTVTSYVPITVIITERRGAVRKRMNALDNAREARATDMLLNYETVKLFCAESLEVRQYDTATWQYQAAEYWQLAFLALLAIVQGAVVWIGMSAGVIICIKGVVDGSLTVGDAVLFITVVNQLYVPLSVFGSYYRQVQKALVDVENMFDLLATEPNVRDKPRAKPLAIVSGAVDFRDVVFSYHPLGDPVLKGVSFGIQGGRTLAVVGATGSGKSTILKLLLRFYDPISGSINIDDQDIKNATLASVRKTISVVPQDAVLFNQSVAYNIRYGAPEATDEEVAQAAAIAHIHSAIVNSFKKGYDTRVGERGVRLSGGEKQRVAFARAVVKRPSILILDEATSALDSLTEQQIQSSLRAIRSHVTTIIVAHRLSTIMDADTILVLDRGQVAQCGSHNELLESGGLYACMWARQLSTELERPEVCAQPPSALGDTYSMAGSDADSEDEDDGRGQAVKEENHTPPPPIDKGSSLCSSFVNGAAQKGEHRGSRGLARPYRGDGSSSRGREGLESGAGWREEVSGSASKKGSTFGGRLAGEPAHVECKSPNLRGSNMLQGLDGCVSSTLWSRQSSGASGDAARLVCSTQQHLALHVQEEEEKGRDMQRSGDVSHERTPDFSRHPTPKKRLAPKRDASCSDDNDERAQELEGTEESRIPRQQQQANQDDSAMATNAAAALLSQPCNRPSLDDQQCQHSYQQKPP